MVRVKEFEKFKSRVCFLRVLIECHDNFVWLPKAETEPGVEVKGVGVVPASTSCHSALPTPVVKSKRPGGLS